MQFDLLGLENGSSGSGLSAGTNNYIARPIDVEKLLSLLRVWMRI
jgi:hypothetical protein